MEHRALLFFLFFSSASSPDYPSLDIEKQLYRPALSNSRNNSLTASGGQSLSSGGGGLDSRRTSGQLLAGMWIKKNTVLFLRRDWMDVLNIVLVQFER